MAIAVGLSSFLPLRWRLRSITWRRDEEPQQNLREKIGFSASYDHLVSNRGTMTEVAIIDNDVYPIARCRLAHFTLNLVPVSHKGVDHVAMTDYADFVAWRAIGDSDEPVVNCFAMAALRSADGAFLLGEMAPHTMNGGQIYFPSGITDRVYDHFITPQHVIKVSLNNKRY
jgi:hypothetical protein